MRIDVVLLVILAIILAILLVSLLTALLLTILAALRKYEVSAAEVGDQDRHGRAQIGVAVVAAEPEHVREVLDNCERAVVARPEVELLSVRRRLIGDDDFS